MLRPGGILVKNCADRIRCGFPEDIIPKRRNRTPKRVDPGTLLGRSRQRMADRSRAGPVIPPVFRPSAPDIGIPDETRLHAGGKMAILHQTHFDSS